ncbi:MAG: universal stress protein [Desulfobulbaceae bacterium]|nr:universal stress protein [Desulfobulbaceae bacterium]
MAKYRKILVAYDGSSSAQSALSLASQLAREDKSWIKVLAVVPTYAGDLELIGIPDAKETITGPGERILAEAKAIAHREGVHILTNLEQGEPYEQIVHVAEDENCDLIVIGRKGRHPLERELVGAVAARVIGHTNKDVLVVPEKSRIAWNNILLVTDGSKFGEMAAARAIEIARERRGKLFAAVAVYTNDEFVALAPEMVNQLTGEAKNILAKVAEEAASAGVAVETFVREGEPHEAIVGLAEALQAEVIVMGSHGRKGLTKLLMGSVTERVIGYATCPILICHSANRR